jgi:growth factor receptor-binding protein 2
MLRDMAETGKLFEALYDFHAQDSDELSFRKGDIILITDDSDDHWWDGEINDNRGKREGKIPAIYVTRKL